MSREIVDILSKYVPMTEELERAILESAFVKTFKRGTVLLKEGAFSNECYFILKGCVRSYREKNGEEKTIEFFTEEQVVSPSCFGKNTPSDINLECIEDTTASVGTPDLEVEMFKKYPQLESMSRVLAEVILVKHQESFAEYKMATPEERYLNLSKNRPDLLQRAPQYQIASYLGIKPESLSRIL